MSGRGPLILGLEEAGSLTETAVSALVKQKEEAGSLTTTAVSALVKQVFCNMGPRQVSSLL